MVHAPTTQQVQLNKAASKQFFSKYTLYRIGMMKKNGSIGKVIQICMIKLLHLRQNRTLNKKMIAVTMPEDDTQC